LVPILKLPLYPIPALSDILLSYGYQLYACVKKSSHVLFSIQIACFKTEKIKKYYSFFDSTHQYNTARFTAVSTTLTGALNPSKTLKLLKKNQSFTEWQK